MLSINIVGVPDWVEQGPRPILNAGSIVSPDNPATGAVQSLAVNPNNPMQMYAGTVNGGVWRSDNIDPANPGNVTWTPLTDELGSLAIGSIEFSPLDATGNTLYVGTGTFSNLTTNPGGPPIGILRTTDGGATWENFAVNLGTQPRIKAVLPTSIDLDSGAGVDQMVLVAGIGGGGGLYRSDDNGETFTLLSGSNGLPFGTVSQLIADPNDTSRFYAAVPGGGGGVFRGDFDAGTTTITWTAMNNGIVAADIGTSANIQLAAHDDGANTVLYVGLADPPTGINATLTGVYTSTDDGANWNPLGTPATFNAWSIGGSGYAMIADPTDDQVVYIGGLGAGSNVYRYNPGGGTWDLIVGAGTSSGSRPHADPRDYLFIGNDVLVEADDGGIYFIQDPLDSGNNDWQSFIGETTTGQALGDAEIHNAAWDSVSGVIFGGAQDNGTSVQQTSGDLVSTAMLGGDGGDVVVDVNTLAGMNQSIRFFSSQNLGININMMNFQGNFRRQVFDANNMPVGGAVNVLPAAGLAGFNAQFITPVEINAIAPTAAQLMAGLSTRVVVGGGGANPVYESNDAGTAANPTWTAVPVAAGFGTVTAMAYGGTSGGGDNADVLWVGDNNGVVYLRTTAGGTLNPTASAFPGANVQDIVLDPNDWQHAFVASSTGVWETTNMGMTWMNRTGNLQGTNLQTIEFVENGAVDALLVGALGGVYRMLTDAVDVWNEYGLGLPNAVTFDLEYNAVADVLLAATFGRGAWIVENASATITELACLQVTGDNNDNIMSLEADLMNPLRFIADDGLGNRESFEKALFSKVQFFGMGGDDTILIDSNGADPGGSLDFVMFLVEVDGGTHNTGDQLILDDSSSDTGATVTITDTEIGAGASDTLFGTDGRLTYTEIEEIDLNLSDIGGDVVTVESTSAATTIHGNGGNDVFTVEGNSNPLTIEGGDGSDLFTVESTGAPVMLFGNDGNDVFTVEGNSDLLTIEGGDGSDLFTVESTGAPVALFGNGDNDQFFVGTGDLTTIAAPVTIDAGDGVDSLQVDDSGRNDVVDYYIDPMVIAICNCDGPPPVRIDITLFDGTLEFARLDATDGVNRFDVTPSTATVFTIDGNLPPPGTLNGDFLSVRFEGTTGRQLTYDAATGNGMWTFDPPHQTINFESIEKLNFFPVLAYGADAAVQGQPTVKVVDAELGTELTTFLAYEADYREGVRVAVGDINGDGIPEILTAPGRNHAPLVKVFDLLTGAEIPGTRFHAFPKSYIGGVNLALGDLDDDGLNDVAAAPSRGKTEIRTFLNDAAVTPNRPFDGNDYNRFLAFDKNFIGGATIAVGDVRLDNQAEIIIGSGTGMRAEVRIFDGLTSGSPHTPAPFARRFYPFDPSVRGGVWVALANIDGGTKFEIVVGAGVGGGGRMETYDLADLKNPFSSFTAYTGNGSNAPVRVAAVDIDANGKSDIFTAQGPDGKSQTIRRTPPLGPLVDFLFENDPEFLDGFFLAADVHAESFVCCDS